MHVLNLGGGRGQWSALWLVFVGALVVGCATEDDGGTACTPGQVVSCPCNGGGSGTQTCADDGSRLGACSCSGVVSDAGSGDEGGGGSNSFGDDWDVCFSNSDCATGSCVQPNNASGFCRALCDDDGDCGDEERCRPLGPSEAACLPSGGTVEGDFDCTISESTGIVACDTASVTVTWSGVPIEFEEHFAILDTLSGTEFVVVQLNAEVLDNRFALVLLIPVFNMEVGTLEVPRRADLQGLQTNIQSSPRIMLVGLGSITIDDAGTAVGERVSGSIDAETLMYGTEGALCDVGSGICVGPQALTCAARGFTLELGDICTEGCTDGVCDGGGGNPGDTCSQSDLDHCPEFRCCCPNDTCATVQSCSQEGACVTSEAQVCASFDDGSSPACRF